MLMYEPPIGKVVDFKLVTNVWCSVVVFTSSDVVVGSSVVLGIRIMCPSGATCLPADCCFSELAL
jgi:hypothetical protein